MVKTPNRTIPDGTLPSRTMPSRTMPSCTMPKVQKKRKSQTLPIPACPDPSMPHLTRAYPTTKAFVQSKTLTKPDVASPFLTNACRTIPQKLIERGPNPTLPLLTRPNPVIPRRTVPKRTGPYPILKKLWKRKPKPNLTSPTRTVPIPTCPNPSSPCHKNYWKRKSQA